MLASGYERPNTRGRLAYRNIAAGRTASNSGGGGDSDRHFGALQLGAAALVELTMFIALANLMARSNVAMGIESQEFSAACDLKPLALASSA